VPIRPVYVLFPSLCTASISKHGNFFSRGIEEPQLGWLSEAANLTLLRMKLRMRSAARRKKTGLRMKRVYGAIAVGSANLLENPIGSGDEELIISAAIKQVIYIL